MTMTETTETGTHKVSSRAEGKGSPGGIIFAIVMFAFAAGFNFGGGLVRFMHARADFEWAINFSFAVAFLFLCVILSVHLLRRIRKGAESTQ